MHIWSPGQIMPEPGRVKVFRQGLFLKKRFVYLWCIRETEAWTAETNPWFNRHRGRTSGLSLEPGCGCDPAFLDGCLEHLVITTVLLCVIARERDDRPVECIGLPQVSGDPGSVAGLRVGPCQVPAAELSVIREPYWRHPGGIVRVLPLNRPLFHSWGKLINIDSSKITLYEASQVPAIWWTGYCYSKCLCYRGNHFFNFYTELFLFSLVLISEWRSQRKCQNPKAGDNVFHDWFSFRKKMSFREKYLLRVHYYFIKKINSNKLKFYNISYF